MWARRRPTRRRPTALRPGAFIFITDLIGAITRLIDDWNTDCQSVHLDHDRRRVRSRSAIVRADRAKRPLGSVAGAAVNPGESRQRITNQARRVGWACCVDPTGQLAIHRPLTAARSMTFASSSSNCSRSARVSPLRVANSTFRIPARIRLAASEPAGVI